MNDATSQTSLSKESLTELVGSRVAPCLSLYQPMHRRLPESQQDPIRFRNLVKELEASFHQAYPTFVRNFLTGRGQVPSVSSHAGLDIIMPIRTISEESSWRLNRRQAWREVCSAQIYVRSRRGLTAKIMVQEMIS